MFPELKNLLDNNDESSMLAQEELDQLQKLVEQQDKAIKSLIAVVGSHPDFAGPLQRELSGEN